MPAHRTVSAGAALLLNLSASPYRLGVQQTREALFSEQIRTQGVPLVYVNQVGGNDDLLFDGASLVLDAQGTVRVSTRAASNGEAVLQVEDDGPGIPEASQERIFEVFYSSRGGGTGLGLPIARQIVERHGGHIELESTVGVGTKFTIRLPRRHARSAPAEQS